MFEDVFVDGDDVLHTTRRVRHSSGSSFVVQNIIDAPFVAQTHNPEVHARQEATDVPFVQRQGDRGAFRGADAGPISFSSQTPRAPVVTQRQVRTVEAPQVQTTVVDAPFEAQISQVQHIEEHTVQSHS